MGLLPFCFPSENSMILTIELEIVYEMGIILHIYWLSVVGHPSSDWLLILTTINLDHLSPAMGSEHRLVFKSIPKGTCPVVVIQKFIYGLLRSY